MTSDSANTVHMLEMTVGCPAAAKRASSAWLTPNRSAMISKKRPVPAEHLSFMTNLRNLAARKADSLGVLPTDVDDGAVFAEERRRAASVAGDLGDHLVRVWNGDTAIPRGDHRHLVHLEALAGKRTAHLLGNFHAGKPRVE